MRFLVNIAKFLRKAFFMELITYNQFRNILRHFNVLPVFFFTTSETMGDYYL